MSDQPAPEKVQGPASYFPAIEARYGRTIEEWTALLEEHRAANPDIKHMQLVAWLKTEHAMGHGHANALVAGTRQG